MPVSVIIPTYNRERTIKRAIMSVLSQTYDNLEVIVIDDCSDDGTKAVIEMIDDSRLFYYRNETNGGASFSRNIGVTRARYDIIAFHDSDDLWYPDKLEKQMRLFADNPQYGLIYCPYLYKKDGFVKRVPAIDFQIEELQGNMLQSLLEASKIGTPTMLLPKAVFNEVGGFDTTLSSLEDWDLSLRVSAKYDIGFCEDVLMEAEYSDDGVNAEVRNSEKHLSARLKVLKQYWNIFEDKEIFLNNLQNILRLICMLDKDKQDFYAGELVPNIIPNKMIFNLLIEEKQRSLRFSEKYNNLLKMIPEEEFVRRFKETVANSENAVISIYGYGFIGKNVAKILSKNNYKIKSIIDRKLLQAEYTIERPDALSGTADCIIVTVPDPLDEIKDELLKQVECQIINIKDI